MSIDLWQTINRFVNQFQPIISEGIPGLESSIQSKKDATHLCIKAILNSRRVFSTLSADLLIVPSQAINRL